MSAPRREGFTLIEMMAVITLVGMIFALGLPRLGSTRWRELGDAAESIASSLEFARQRAVMTGVPHRVRIDLENGDWRVEWLVSESEAASGELEAGAAGGGSLLAGALSGALGSDTADGDEPDPRAPIDLHPPAKEGLDYYPIPNRLGRVTSLDDDDELYFVGLEGNSGWVEGGEVQIVFDADGTTDFVLLELADAEDRHMTLEIEPLLERVRRREGAARS